MCFNLTVGLLTPPVGTVLYTTSMSTGVPIDRMVKTIWPWVFVLMIVLFLVAFVPSITLWLPKLLAQ